MFLLLKKGGVVPHPMCAGLGGDCRRFMKSAGDSYEVAARATRSGSD